MTPYLLAPLESHIRDQAVFAVLTQKINPVLGSPENHHPRLHHMDRRRLVRGP